MFIVKKQYEENDQCDQVKGVKPIQFSPLFQNREFKTVEDLLNKKNKNKKNRVDVQLDHNDAYLCVFFIGRPKENCVSVEKNSVPVSLRVPGTSPMF